jgi:subtilase family serine protease
MTVRQALASVMSATAGLAVDATVMAETTFAGLVLLRGSHPREPVALTRASSAKRTMPLELRIVLDLRYQAALKQLLADQQKPGSPRYPQWLTPQAFFGRFEPPDKQVGKVTEWLKGEGFEVTAVDRMGQQLRRRQCGVLLILALI